jgi:predicted transcriptional regulator
VPAALSERLQELARIQDRSASSVIRAALREHLERQEQT